MFEPDSELVPDTEYRADITTVGSEIQPVTSKVSDYTWLFNTTVTQNSGIAIISVNNSSPIWGVDTVGISGNTNNSSPGDFVIVDWGDNSTSNSTLSESGLWDASHLYNASAVGLRQVIANLSSSAGVIKATTTMAPDMTVRKHATSISLRVPEVMTANTTFTAAGYLTDLSLPNSPVELSGEEISFNGSGASSLQSVFTQGVRFWSLLMDLQPSISISSCSAVHLMRVMER